MTHEEQLQKVVSFEEENKRLREQVKRLMAGENKLYVLQDHLNSQQRIYIRLAEISRELSVSLNVNAILKTVVHFVIYGFNYQRCAVFLEDLSDHKRKYTVRAYEGYYEEEEDCHIKQAVITGDEEALSETYGEVGFVCHTGEEHDEHTLSLGRIFLMDEYFVFALKRKEAGINGFLIAGNTKEQARYQTSVNAEGEMLVALSNLAVQTAITLANVQSYRALEKERQLLDRLVDERTRELSEALDAAHEAVRVKAEFLAKVSHELRTPLNSIINIPSALAGEYAEVELYQCTTCKARFQSEGDETDLICPDCKLPLYCEKGILFNGDPKEHLRFLKLLGEQGRHLLSIVEDVLDFSKLGSAHMEINYTEADAKKMLEEIEPVMENSVTGKKCIIKYPKLEAPLLFEADKLRIKQILINLIGNAIKFTPDGKEISVDVRESEDDGGIIVFTVADQGIGIPEDQLETIFESFRQVDGSHTRSFGGTGLGLAISRQLVEMHGGKIKVSSVLGEGSTFEFYVPKKLKHLAVQRSETASLSIVPAPKSSRYRGYGKVVVVDDEPAQLSVARKFLEKEGYDVTLVSDASTAVDIIREIIPRFVIVDIMMPNVNGFEIIIQMKQDPSLSQMPIFASTAFHYNKDKAEELGALWLPKPWSQERLSAGAIEPFVSKGEIKRTSIHPPKRTRLSDLVSKILYVEDEDANFEVTSLSLRGKYVLDRARDSKEAYECLTTNTYDLILMDLQLAGSDLNGIEMCEALTGRRTDNLPNYAMGVKVRCPIVVVTAYASLYSKEDMLKAGAADFITKPVDFAHLLIVLSRLMIRGEVSDIN